MWAERKKKSGTSQFQNFPEERKKDEDPRNLEKFLQSDTKSNTWRGQRSKRVEKMLPVSGRKMDTPKAHFEQGVLDLSDRGVSKVNKSALR